MDIVGLSLITTFFAMMAIAAFTMPATHPPYERRKVSCPLDHKPARLHLDWNRARRAVEVAECDHMLSVPDCQQGCLTQVRQSFGTALPTIVMP
jgi:hypothetical protein